MSAGFANELRAARERILARERDPQPPVPARRRRPRRHSAEVTSDRLLDALNRWPDAFDGGDRDAIGRIRHVLDQIATGDE